MTKKLFLIAAILALAGCRETKPVQRIGELEALVGKTSESVHQALGNPQPGDSTVLHYYDVMVRSEVDAKPRQRTVIISVKGDTVTAVHLE